MHSYSGISGISGYSGFSGISGYSGYSGQSGFSGTSGISGYSGRDGQFGGASFYYQFDTKTDTNDPGQGRLNVNNNNLSLATVLTIHDDDRFFSNIHSFLQTIDDSSSSIKGYTKITEEANNLNFVIYAITGNHTDDTLHFDVPISYVSGVSPSIRSKGTPLSSSQTSIHITFVWN